MRYAFLQGDQMLPDNPLALSAAITCGSRGIGRTVLWQWQHAAPQRLA